MRTFIVLRHGEACDEARWKMPTIDVDWIAVGH